MIKVILEGKSIEVLRGTVAQNLADYRANSDQLLAAKINGHPVDLSTSLEPGDNISFLSFADPEGKEIFWHSSAHLLAHAVSRIWPEAKPTIGPAIDQGFFYDFADLKISDKDLEKIDEEVGKIISEDHSIERSVFLNKAEAASRVSGNKYKMELLETIEGKEITGYQQGEFFDLCRGPHLTHLGIIKAFKTLKVSGAYWKGDSSSEMLTRIYGISYPEKQLLDNYLATVKEAEKRDHKILGPQLDLFSLKEEAAGIPFIHPKGMVIWNNLISFLRDLLKQAGYQEIKTPLLMSKDLWEKSGHWNHYRANMYTFEIENRAFAIKPMSCPGCMLYYQSRTHSYRDLPMRIAEIGNVHRYEPSGALSGLVRVRSFHQDDAHIFMQRCDIKKEILAILELVKSFYTVFGLSYRMELSTRPSNSMGTDLDWDISTRGLEEALEEWGDPFHINRGDGAFYGPKIDIHVTDAIGRSWQCGTIQLDMSLPERFKLEYINSNGVPERPVMLHRAIMGSIERFLGILIEHFAGKFPLWISPSPIRIIPISERHANYARQIREEIVKAQFICEIDDGAESVNKKIRRAQIMQVNYMLTVGDKESSNHTINLRTRQNKVIGEISLDEFLKGIKKEKEKKDLFSFW